MEHVTPLPAHGSVFFDHRDHGRSLRLSYHRDQAVFVISLWRYDVCLGTFQLPAEDAAEFVHEFVGPLAQQAAEAAPSDTRADSA